MSVTIDREELAWAAGFFDGEGTCSYMEKAGFAMIRLAQSEKGPLIRFHRATGRLGKIYGPYSPRHKDRWQRRPQWALQIARREHVQAVVAMLWFKLGPTKRAQARRVLERLARDCRRGHPKQPGGDGCGRCTQMYWAERRRAKALASEQTEMF